MPATPRDPDRPSTYFTGLSEGYARYRPSYPDAVFSLLVADLPRPARAADVGCGTGISTRGLARAGAIVTGVDPNPDMLAAARATPPLPRTRRAATYREGTGEATGFAGASLDLVCCAQSFHWFDRDAAFAEFARILRPGGRLALVWNVRERIEAGAVYADVVREAKAHTQALGCSVPAARDDDGPVPAPFGPRRVVRIDNPQQLDRNGLIGRARSASYFPRSGPERARLEGMLHDAFDRYAVDGRVTLPQHTSVAMMTRR